MRVEMNSGQFRVRVRVGVRVGVRVRVRGGVMSQPQSLG